MRVEYRILREIPKMRRGQTYCPVDYERVQFREVYNNTKGEWADYGKTPDEFDMCRLRASLCLLNLPLVEIDHNVQANGMSTL